MPPKPSAKVRSSAALNSVTSELPPQLISHEPSAERRAGAAAEAGRGPWVGDFFDHRRRLCRFVDLVAHRPRRVGQVGVVVVDRDRPVGLQADVVLAAQRIGALGVALSRSGSSASRCRPASRSLRRSTFRSCRRRRCGAGRSGSRRRRPARRRSCGRCRAPGLPGRSATSGRSPRDRYALGAPAPDRFVVGGEFLDYRVVDGVVRAAAVGASGRRVRVAGR